MQSNISIMEDDGCLLQSKDQGHQRAHSHESLKTDVESNSQNSKMNEVERVNCECCGMVEDCTPTYISRIREKYYGKWLCGLCSEAVQEKKRKYCKFTNEQALEAHMAICKQFNRNTRVNPKLSLADAMINFARRRSQLRHSGESHPSTARPARTCSCGPWLNRSLPFSTSRKLARRTLEQTQMREVFDNQSEETQSGRDGYDFDIM